MADTTLEEALAGEQGGMGGRHPSLRWTQPCMRQAVHREPKKWSRSGPGVQARTSKNQNSPENAARERSRVRNLRQAFQSLQAALPSVPPDTKLSKLDVLVLATNYIAHLTETLDQDQGGAMCDHLTLQRAEGYLHPVKKWPMRSLLYCGNIGERLTGANPSQEECRTPSSTAEVRADRTDLDVSNHS
ncbi:transcription factor 23 [Clarias gariepinus]